MGGRTGDLVAPTPPQGSLLSLLGLEPPSSRLPQLPVPKARELGSLLPPLPPAAPKLLSHPQLLESGGGGGAPKPWRSPSPDPSVLGPHLVLEAPTCVGSEGHLRGGDTGQEQLQVKDLLGAHMTCCVPSPINVYPGAEAPEGYHCSPSTCLVQAPLSLRGVAGLGGGSLVLDFHEWMTW